MRSLYYSSLLLLLSISCQSQISNTVIVYSVSGSVKVLIGKDILSIKSHDVLDVNSLLQIDKAAKFYYITSDNKLHVFSIPGIFSISEIIKKNGQSKNEFGKAFDLIIHHFIEKGHSEAEIAFSRVGAINRGSEDEWLFFPNDDIKIFKLNRIRPVFNYKVVDSGSTIHCTLFHDNHVVKEYNFKPEESIDLDFDYNSKGNYVIRFSDGFNTKQMNVIFASKQESGNINQSMTVLKKNMLDENDESYLFSLAMFFEANAFWIDAYGCYEKLILLAPDNEEYAKLKFNCLHHNSN
jgi:hypothetical protein